MRKPLAAVLGLAMALAATPAFAALNAYLQLDGIAGESKESTHQNWLDVSGFTLDPQVLNIGSQSSGAGSGKVTFNPFTITRKIDRASPSLSAASTAHRTIPHATIEFTNDGEQAVSWRGVVTDAVVTGYKVRPATANGVATEEVTLQPGNLEIWSRTSPPNGTPGAWVKRDLKEVRDHLPRQIIPVATGVR
jgi:type VI secretion system Hcp family effector